jgi:hypothetical protein
METQESYSYSTYIDEQRLREAFFKKPLHQPDQQKIPSSKKQPNFSWKILIPLMFIIILFLAKYEMILVPRNNFTPKPGQISLTKAKDFSWLTYAGKKEGKLLSSPLIYISADPKADSGIKINFHSSIDLRQKSLLLSLKNPKVSIRITAVAKDSRYFSNALSPIIKSTDSEDKNSDIKVYLDFDSATMQKTNIADIRQIALYFYPQIKEDQMGLVIKDITLIDNALTARVSQ